MLATGASAQEIGQSGSFGNAIDLGGVVDRFSGRSFALAFADTACQDFVCVAAISIASFV